MGGAVHTRHVARAVLFAAVCAMVLSLFVSTIAAQETAGETAWGEMYIGQAADYLLTVRSQPKELVVGVGHFEVAISGPSDIPPDLEVRLYASPPSGAKQTARALNTPEHPFAYVANLELEHVGDWTMTVDLTSGDVTQSVSFQAYVSGRSRDPSSSSVGTAVWGIMVASVLGVVAWLVYRSRRARAARGLGRSAPPG